MTQPTMTRTHDDADDEGGASHLLMVFMTMMITIRMMTVFKTQSDNDH